MDTPKYHYDTSAVQVGNTVRDGDDFIVLVRSKQSEGFEVWSSTSKDDTPILLRQATRQLEPATT